MTIDFTERFDIPSGTAQTRGHGANGRTWKSPSHRKAAAAWQALFERHRPEKPLSGPVTVYACLLYHNDKAGAAGRPKTTRPDLDNLAKVFTDALVSAMCARTAVLGALLNVEINLGGIRDEAFVADTRASVASLRASAVSAEREILDSVTL